MESLYIVNGCCLETFIASRAMSSFQSLGNKKRLRWGFCQQFLWYWINRYYLITWSHKALKKPRFKILLSSQSETLNHATTFEDEIFSNLIDARILQNRF